MSQQATGFFREQNMLVRKHFEKQIKELKNKYADVVKKNKELYKRNRLIALYCQNLEKERDQILISYDSIIEFYKKETEFYKTKMKNKLKNGKEKLTLRERINMIRKEKESEERITIKRKKLENEERLPKIF